MIKYILILKARYWSVLGQAFMICRKFQILLSHSILQFTNDSMDQTPNSLISWFLGFLGFFNANGGITVVSTGLRVRYRHRVWFSLTNFENTKMTVRYTQNQGKQKADLHPGSCDAQMFSPSTFLSPFIRPTVFPRFPYFRWSACLMVTYFNVLFPKNQTLLLYFESLKRALGGSDEEDLPRNHFSS